MFVFPKLALGKSCFHNSESCHPCRTFVGTLSLHDLPTNQHTSSSTDPIFQRVDNCVHRSNALKTMINQPPVRVQNHFCGWYFLNIYDKPFPVVGSWWHQSSLFHLLTTIKHYYYKPLLPIITHY